MSATETTPLMTPAETPATSSYAPSAYEIALQTDQNGSAFIVPSVYEDDVDDSDDDSGMPPVHSELRPDLWIILGGMWIGSFLSAIDSTIVASTLSVIGSEFSVSNSISWLGTSYLLTQTAAQPLYGKCSDIFGRRAVSIFCSSVFLLGSLACGVARTYPQLLAARAFTGIGGAGLTVVMMIVSADLVPLRRRGMYQAVGNLIYSVGAALGGPIGGLLGDTIGWRYSFLIQVPVCCLHLAMILWKVDDSFASYYETAPMSVKIKRVDFLGSFLLVFAIASLLLGLSLGGNELPWDSPIVYSSVAAGIILLLVFLACETYVAREPIMSPHMLFSRTPGFICLTYFWSSLAQFATIYSVPLWFAVIKRAANSYAGLHLLPNVLSTSISSLVAGFVMVKTGRYRTMLVLSGLLTVVGPLCMVFWDKNDTPDWFFWVSTAPAGLGFGGILSIALVALLSAVQPTEMAAATACSYLFRATGSVLGISLSTALLQNTLKRALPHVVDSPSIIDKIRLDIGYIDELPAALQGAVIDCYQHSMRWVFIGITIAATFTLLSILPVQHYDLPSRLDRKK